MCMYVCIYIYIHIYKPHCLLISVSTVVISVVQQVTEVVLKEGDKHDECDLFDCQIQKVTKNMRACMRQGALLTVF